jgi:hypothetical protein
MFTLKVGPWRCELLRGAPLRAGDYQLIPIALFTSITRRRASLMESGASIIGFQTASVTPIALLAAGRGERRLVLLLNPTRLIMAGLALMSLTVLSAAIRSARRAGK